MTKKDQEPPYKKQKQSPKNEISKNNVKDQEIELMATITRRKSKEEKENSMTSTLTINCVNENKEEGIIKERKGSKEEKTNTNISITKVPVTLESSNESAIKESNNEKIENKEVNEKKELNVVESEISESTTKPEVTKLTTKPEISKSDTKPEVSKSNPEIPKSATKPEVSKSNPEISTSTTKPEIETPTSKEVQPIICKETISVPVFQEKIKKEEDNINHTLNGTAIKTEFNDNKISPNKLPTYTTMIKSALEEMNVTGGEGCSKLEILLYILRKFRPKGNVNTITTKLIKILENGTKKGDFLSSVSCPRVLKKAPEGKKDVKDCDKGKEIKPKEKEKMKTIKTKDGKIIKVKVSKLKKKEKAGKDKEKVKDKVKDKKREKGCCAISSQIERATFNNL